MSVKQISVFLENKPGSLHTMTQVIFHYLVTFGEEGRRSDTPAG